MAVFNGPVLGAYSEILPDLTVNQMNRLNDSAYAANTVVPKQQSKVVAIFLPQKIFLSSGQQKQFWNEPTTLWPTVDLRKLEVYVDGNFITNVEDLVPSVTTGVIAPEEMKKFQSDKPEVTGTILGNSFSGSDIKLLNTDLQGVKIEAGSVTDQRLNFVVSSDLPIAPGTILKLGVVKNQTTKEVDITIQYPAAVPALAKADPNQAKQGDKELVVSLTGTNFLPGSTQVVVTPADQMTVGTVTVKSSTSAEVKISVANGATPNARQIAVMTPGGSSAGNAFTIIKK